LGLVVGGWKGRIMGLMGIMGEVGMDNNGRGWTGEERNVRKEEGEVVVRWSLVVGREGGDGTDGGGRHACRPYVVLGKVSNFSTE
jgi:hypothetical protein